MSKGGIKGWKKVHSGPDHSVLRNEHGHELKIAHSALSPKMRGQLAEIPVHTPDVKDTNPASNRTVSHEKGRIKMADGGDVKKNDPNKAWTQKDKEDFSKGASSSDPTTLEQAKENLKKALGFADGGEVNPKLEQSKTAPREVARPNIPESHDAQVDFLYHDAKVMGPGFADGGEVSIGDLSGAAPSEIPEALRAKELPPAPVEAPPALYGVTPDTQSTMSSAPLPGSMEAAPMMPMAASQAPAPQAAPAGNQDPFGTQAAAGMFSKGIEEQRQGIAGEARALGQQGKAEAQALDAGQEMLKKNLQDYQAKMEKLNAHRQELLQAYGSGEIDPNHYIGSMGTGKRIATGIGLILGGLGGALTGQENPALKMINLQIDRDIEAQKANLGKKKSLLEFNQQEYGNLRDAADATRIQMNDLVSHQLKVAAAKSMDPLAKARALQAVGKLEADNANMAATLTARNTVLSGKGIDQIAPELKVTYGMPEGPAKTEAMKQLKDMQEAVSLRDDALEAFDKITKLQTLGSRLGSPLQSSRQIEAIEGPVLDKLTKDTSGRVTPETVKLIKGIFSKVGNSPETIAQAKRSLNNLLTVGMHYPALAPLRITPDQISRFNKQGQANIKVSAPVEPNKKK